MPSRSEHDTLADEITVLILLKALGDLGMTTRRVKLQKLTYFANVLASLSGQRLTHHEFFVYKHGPFSKQLYSDIEVLVTHSLVKATQMDEVEEDEKSFEYETTPEGISRVDKALRDPEFKAKYRVILETVQAVGELTTSQIRKLSYGELNFKQAREKGLTTVIDPSFPFCLEAKKIVKDVAQNDFGMQLSDEDASLLYLKLVKALAG